MKWTLEDIHFFKRSIKYWILFPAAILEQNLPAARMFRNMMNLSLILFTFLSSFIIKYMVQWLFYVKWGEVFSHGCIQFSGLFIDRESVICYRENFFLYYLLRYLVNNYYLILSKLYRFILKEILLIVVPIFFSTCIICLYFHITEIGKYN